MTTEFRSPLLPRLLTALLFIAVIVGIALAWLPLELPRSWGGLNDRRLIAVAFAVVPVLPVLWWALVWQNVKVAVTPDRVEVRRGSRVKHSWDRCSTRFGSQVTQQRSYGMKVGATRVLIANPAGGGAVQVLVPGLSRDRFNELYRLLAPLDVPATDEPARFGGYSGPAPMAPPVGAPVVMAPPAGAPVPMAPPAGAPVSMAPPVGAPVPMAPPSGTPVAPGGAPVGYGAPAPAVPQPGAAPLAAHGVWTPRGSWAGGRRAPERIDVAPGLLVVDGEQLPFSSLAAIQLAPPGYPDWTLAVSVRGGATRRWRLGASGADAVTPHATYAGLIDTLRNAAAGYPGLVSFDLG